MLCAAITTRASICFRWWLMRCPGNAKQRPSLRSVNNIIASVLEAFFCWVSDWPPLALTEPRARPHQRGGAAWYSSQLDCSAELNRSFAISAMSKAPSPHTSRSRLEADAPVRPAAQSKGREIPRTDNGDRYCMSSEHFGPWFGNLREYLAHLV